MQFIWRYLLLFLFLFLNKVSGNEIGTHSSQEKRIIGGEETFSGQYPFAAAIHVQTSDSSFFCGGAIYNVYYILTAGHCAYNAVHFTIQEGSHTLEGNDSNRVTVTTSTYYIHSDFNPVTIENDIALIRLRLAVGFTTYIRPAYLASADIQSEESAVAIGWGQTSDYTPEFSNTLRYVTVSALSNEECRVIYGNQITDNMLCVAGNYNQGTCIGDNGSPLTQHDAFYNKHYIFGIASFVSGNGCESTNPSGYTRVYPYIDWIKNTAVLNK